MSPSPATSTPRPCPDYSKRLSDFHYLPSTKTPTSGRKPDDYQPRAQIKQIFQEGKLKAGDKKGIKEFSEKYVVSEKLVADYIEHLTDIEIKDKRGKRTERKHNKTTTLTGKISITETSCHPLEKVNINFIINHHNIALKERKMRK